MRKTIIPAAIVLAASAVPMQAQEVGLSFEDAQKEISAVSSKIGTYPKDVQDMFASELSNLETELRAVRDDDETPDAQKAIKYATIRDNAKDVLEKAKVVEANYQTAKQKAVNAWDAARAAYTTAYDNIYKLVVPSVKEEFLNTLITDYPQPAIYTDDDLKALYESIEESEKIESARNKYTADVEQLVKDAQNADSKEQAEQPKRKTALENSITAVKNNVQPTYNDVYSYVDYGKDVDLKKISVVTAALEGIKNDVATSRTNWELTAEKAAAYEQKITAQATTLTTTAGDALAAAKAKAEEDAAKLVSGLTEYDNFGPDDYTTAAKNAANDAIKVATAAAVELGKLYVQNDYNTQASVVEGLVTEANAAITAVTSCVNNYKAYDNLKKTYDILKAAYDAAAIELSGLKANKEIDDQFYNEANTKLNEVAKMLETFAQTNQSKYEAKDYKGYTESEPGDVYNGVKALLNPAYDTADEIKKIVIDAKSYNDTLATLKGYQTQVEGINATVSHDKADDNEDYAAAVNTLNVELGDEKSALATELEGLVKDYRTNKTLGKSTAEIGQEISDLNAAITTAQADLDAYVSSKEQVAKWTGDVDAILGQIPDPVSQDYKNHAVLEGDRTTATTYQSEIDQLGVDADNAFKASPRTSRVVWDNIQNGTNYGTLLSSLSTKVESDSAAYKAWLDEQGDVAAYNLGKQYYTELQAALDAAKDATADNALGFQDDQDAITELQGEVEEHGTTGHQFNDCILAMASWKTQYGKIKQSIETHKQAWLDNEKYYAEKTDTLSRIIAVDADQTNLYVKLNNTNKTTINTAITDAQAALNTAHAAQNASSFDAAAKQTEILNLIAQLKLREELAASGIGGDEGAINYVRTKLATKGWNPNNVYSTKLNTLETEYTTFTANVQYADYQTKHDRIDNLKEGNLKAAILAVATDAKANFDAYTTQTNAQTAAKAVWADIYSKVGAMYVDAEDPTDFSRAQKLYQGDLNLNKCFTVLTGYDTEIDNAYNTGKSASFNTETYDKAIAKNKAAMDGIYKAAYENKAAYDGQMEKFGQLETYYSEQIDYLDTQIAKVIESINTDGATDKELESLKAQLESLKAQKEALEAAQTDLAAVQTDIDDLKTAVVTAVNEGRSVAYNNDKVEGYDAADDNIRSAIDTIISKADGRYNDNIVAHNTVVKELFLQAYNDAKAAYNEYTFSIEKYAGFKHALDNNGVSAYDKAIKDAQAKIFSLNTQLVEQYNTATKAFDSTTEYVDKEQTNKKEVVSLQGKLKAAYDAFLAETQNIATANKYAEPLSDLAKYYNDAKSAIEAYDIIKGITLDPTEEIKLDEKKAAAVAAYFTFDGKELDGTALESAYQDAAKVNKGPQQLDALRAQVETQTANVLTAWNKAAKEEAEAAVQVAEKCLNDYRAKTYPTGYQNNAGQKWLEILEAESANITTANSAIFTNYSSKKLPGQLATIKSNLEAVATTLAAEESALLGVCQKFIDAYNANAQTIKDISDKVAGYKNHTYAAELTKLIEDAETAVNTANTENKNAFDTLSTSTTEIDSAITAAQTALATLKYKADELVEANQPAGIVNTLLTKAQELRPLYNRAEANAKGHEDAEKACVEIYKDLNTLLTTLEKADDATKETIAANKDDYEAQIESLKARIIAADVEQQAYTALLEGLNGENGVKAALGNVKTYIENSTFKTELNEAFSERIAALDTELLAALTQINIDHANNLCGKTDAVFKGFTAISESIATLDNDVKTKAGELQTAKDHADMRTANGEAYATASAAITELYNELDAQWLVAQEQYLDVWSLFAEQVSTLKSDIKGLQTSLDAAYKAAQNEGRDPSVLDTSAYATTSYYTQIETLMGKFSARQAQFEAEVRVLNSNIADMKTAFDAIVNSISDIAAANEDVQKEQIAIDKAIDEIEAKMQNFGPEDTKDVQDMIDAANARITAFAEFVKSKTYVPGDITGTGSVDINDTFKILDFILEDLSGDTLDENVRKAADMDGDGAFTVADLVQINNLYVYGSKTGPQGSNKVAAAADAEVGSVDMQLDTDRMSVLLDSNTGYSAIQMDVEMPQGVSINEVNFAGDSQKVMVATNTLENGVQRIVLYSSDGSSILNGESSLINLGLAGEGMGIVSIDHIIASTAAGQRHNLMGVTGAYTIVTGIEATETAEGNTSVFDINGMVRKTVQKGVNIVKDAAGKVKKMLMK